LRAEENAAVEKKARPVALYQVLEAGGVSVAEGVMAQSGVRRQRVQASHVSGT